MMYWRYWSFVGLCWITHMVTWPVCALGIHRWRLSTSVSYKDNQPQAPHILRGCRRCRREELYWDDHWHEILSDIEATFDRAREIEMRKVKKDWDRSQRQLRRQLARYGQTLPGDPDLG